MQIHILLKYVDKSLIVSMFAKIPISESQREEKRDFGKNVFV